MSASWNPDGRDSLPSDQPAGMIANAQTPVGDAERGVPPRMASRVAPQRGFSGYQPLMRAYVGQGLRADLERLDSDAVAALVESLKRHGVSEDTISEALRETTYG
jgi:hypothetical protein